MNRAPVKLPANTAPGFLDDSNFAVTYDDGGRVTTWQRDDPAAPLGYNGQQSWTYDDAGNWASTDIGNSTQTREHDNSDQLTKIAANTLQYSPTGCLETDHHGNQYTWDIDNRLSAKTQDSQALGTADYQYDVLGRRVAKDSGGGSSGKTVTLWWNMREVADYETTGTTPGPIHHYLNLPRHNDRLARTVQVGSSEQVQYYHKNYLDHIYAITDEDGDALEHIRYTAFGLPTYYDFAGLKVATSPTGNQFLWNAKRLDPQLGWYLYHYRHYSPELGRWPSRDPIEEDGGVNLYGFVGNGPLYAWDWLGLELAVVYRKIPAADRERMHEAVHNHGMDAHKRAEKEFLEHLELDDPFVRVPGYNNNQPFVPKQPKEYGGRVCAKCVIAEDGTIEFKDFYLTEKTGDWPFVRIHAEIHVGSAPECNDGDWQVGFWHTHPSSLGEREKRRGNRVEYEYTWAGGTHFSAPDRNIVRQNAAQNPHRLPFYLTRRSGSSHREWSYVTEIYSLESRDDSGEQVRSSPQPAETIVEPDKGRRQYN